MATTQSKRIIIIGGSLTGLFAGIVLSRHGHHVTILERTPSAALRDQGAGLATATVIPSIASALVSFHISNDAPLSDFLERYDRTGVRSQVGGSAFLYLRRDGTVKQRLPVLPSVAYTSWDFLYNLLRANFDGGYERTYVPSSPKHATDGETIYLSACRLTAIKDLGLKVQVSYNDPDEKQMTIEADIVIGADGGSSLVRSIVHPESTRKYAGYVIFRGMVKESLLSMETQNFHGDDSLAFFYFAKATQVISYYIPGEKGTTELGERYVTVVWYCNANEAEKAKLLTDAGGIEHKFSLGVGKIRPELRSEQRKLAAEILPACIAEEWNKIEEPFIHAVTDSLATKAVFMEGKVILIGDAVACFRPHTTAGMTQGALHAILLGRVFGDGTMSIDEWEDSILQFATHTSKIGQSMGELSQFGNHPMAEDAASTAAHEKKKD